MNYLALALSLAGYWFLRVGPLPTAMANTCSPNSRQTTRYTCCEGPTGEEGRGGEGRGGEERGGEGMADALRKEQELVLVILPLLDSLQS